MNRISEEEFRIKKRDWQELIRTKIPKFFKMEAKSIFFNFYEPEIIRREIKDDLESFYNSKMKNLMFATSAKVYGYLNQIVSVRIILAKFYKIPLEDIDEKEEKEYKETLKQDMLKGVEEEVDSDDDEFIVTREPVTREPLASTASPNKDKRNMEMKEIHIENRPISQGEEEEVITTKKHGMMDI